MKQTRKVIQDNSLTVILFATLQTLCEGQFISQYSCGHS